MGDMFHEDCPDEWILDALTVMAIARQHTFQVLTKRSRRMREFMSRPELLADIYANWYTFDGGEREVAAWPLPNLWLGVSTERQQELNEREEDLRYTPAAIRFLSCEPLLGQLDARRSLYSGQIHWVIVGGESGRNARPMHPDWARDLRDQCSAAGVAFFFKQWGEWAPNIGAVDGWTINDNPEISRFDHREWEDGAWSETFRPMWCDFSDGNYDEEQCVSRIGKKAAGRLLDGVEHNGMPELAR